MAQKLGDQGGQVSQSSTPCPKILSDPKWQNVKYNILPSEFKKLYKIKIINTIIN